MGKVSLRAMKRFISINLLLFWSFLFGLSFSGRSYAQIWQKVMSRDGIVVTQRMVRGRRFPTFRAVGEIKANVYNVLAVISDSTRYKEWMNRCEEAKLLKKISETEYIMYLRTDAPWPVWDRDAVYHSWVYADFQKGFFEIQFRAEKGWMNRRKGIIRMSKLRGYYRLQAKGESVTKIDYQVDADPEGSLPGWIARRATRSLPLKTIRQLEKQAKRVKGRYDKRITRWKALSKTHRTFGQLPLP